MLWSHREFVAFYLLISNKLEFFFLGIECEGVKCNFLLISIIGLLLQILLDDVKVSEQLLDMVFYMLIVFGCYEQVLLNPHLQVLCSFLFLYSETCVHDAGKP